MISTYWEAVYISGNLGTLEGTFKESFVWVYNNWLEAYRNFHKGLPWNVCFSPVAIALPQISSINQLLVL